MNCDEVQSLIDGYVDDELDLVTSLAIKRHLGSCPNCAPIYQNRLRLRAALSTEALYFRPSEKFEKRLGGALRAESKGSLAILNLSWRGFGLAAALIGVLVVVVAVGLIKGASASAVGSDLAAEVLSSHIRSLMADHIADVMSSDQHTVKPWFDGRLDFSPTVVDLTSQGFHLVGGRLDYLNNRPVAALIYQHDKHLINLFIWPSIAQIDSAPGREVRQGYNLFRWEQSHMVYWAVSDLESGQLEAFVKLIQSQAG